MERPAEMCFSFRVQNHSKTIIFEFVSKIPLCTVGYQCFKKTSWQIVAQCYKQSFCGFPSLKSMLKNETLDFFETVWHEKMENSYLLKVSSHSFLTNRSSNKKCSTILEESSWNYVTQLQEMFVEVDFFTNLLTNCFSDLVKTIFENTNWNSSARRTNSVWPRK